MRIAPALLLLTLALLAGNGPAAEAKPTQQPGVPDKKFQKEIDQAIARGAAWLRSNQKASGQLAVVKSRGHGEHYAIGGTALGGLALWAAGDRPGDAALDKAMSYCRTKYETEGKGRTTYDTGVLLMFLTKYYGKEETKPKRRNKTVTAKGAKNPCQLPDDVKELVRAMATRLWESQKETGGWGYPMGNEDFSNTQYAMLGLRAAKDCGVTVPAHVWNKVMQRMLDTQEKDGPAVERILPPKKPGGPTYVVKSKDRARGWPYQAGHSIITGSMTTAGIAILLIAHDGLMRPRKFPAYKPSKQLEVAQAVQDGFAWMNKNFDVARNPGRGAPNWHYYYLYGLERAGVLGDRPLLGLSDWYLLGARYLVDKQKGDGSWSTGALGSGDEFEASDVLDTAWAILFLKRATKPMPKLPAPVVTD